MKIGVLGCGYWGPNLIRNFSETNRCKVLCYDKDPAMVAKILRRYPNVSAASELEGLIETCDGVVVATPVSTHHALVKQIIQAGKHAFVEKPLTIGAAEAAELVRLAEAGDCILMVGHTFVYSPPVRKVRDYLADGLLGDIYFMSSSRVNLGIHRKDVDVLWDLAPHDVSILLYWLGEVPKRVAAVGRACIGPLVDVAALHFEFPSGVIANLEISWLAPSKLRRMVVVGSRRMIIYDDLDANEKVKLVDKGVLLKDPESFGEHQLSYRTGDILSPKIDPAEPLLVEANHFLDCIQTRQRPITDGRAGLAVVLALEAASRSVYDSGSWVEIPDLETALAMPIISPRAKADTVTSMAAGRAQ